MARRGIGSGIDLARRATYHGVVDVPGLNPREIEQIVFGYACILSCEVSCTYVDVPRAGYTEIDVVPSLTFSEM